MFASLHCLLAGDNEERASSKWRVVHAANTFQRHSGRELLCRCVEAIQLKAQALSSAAAEAERATKAMLTPADTSQLE